MLRDYQRTRTNIKNARMEYLNQRNQRSRQIVEENDRVLEQLLRVKQGAYEQQKLKKEMQNRLDSYERRKAYEKKTRRSESSIDGTRMSSIVKKLMEPARDKIRQRRLNTNQFFNRMNKTQIMDTKLAKRLNHPSSKLLLEPDYRTHDFLGLSAGIIEPKLMKRQNEDPEEFKLTINSSPTLKNPLFFKKYYGGGPSKFDSESGSVKSHYFLIIILSKLRLTMRLTFQSSKGQNLNTRQLHYLRLSSKDLCRESFSAQRGENNYKLIRP